VIVGGRGWFQKLVDWYFIHKRWTVPLSIALLVGVILGVPQTRYPVLGLGLKKNFQVVVLDAKSGKPVTAATVTAGGKRVVTDNKGKATIKSKVGNQKFTVIKKYYKNAVTGVLVPVSQHGGPQKLTIEATGRQVPVVVTNRISGKPLANAVVSASGSETKTDKDGKAILVLPADKQSVEANVKADGYNTSKANVTVTEQEIKENSFALTPAGKVYFLSKLTGKIDVVKTNLDGTGREVVLAGTGNEDNFDTVLLASRDWRYLALKSKRDGGDYAKLFLIETATDKLTTMDEGKASFNLVGWSDSRFVYTVGRIGVQNWEPKGQALKSYDVGSGKLALIDETEGEGTGQFDFAYSLFNQVFILENELVYTKSWQSHYNSGYRLSGKNVSLTSVRPDGSGKKSLKDFPIQGNYSYFSVNLRPYGPKEIYAEVPNQTGKPAYYEYEDGKVAAANDVTPETFNKEYPTYLVSPAGKSVFWTESRDGKTAMFVGDTDANNEKQVGSLSEYTQYGWFTDDYLLVSKNGSELYILPATGGTAVKITDYHRPNASYRGYGGGYGGL
jgi:hypothetical protein